MLRQMTLLIACTIGLGLPHAACAQAGETETQEVGVAPKTGFDYGPLQELYDRYVDGDGLVDYAGLKANRPQLDAVVQQFATARPDRLDSQTEQLAFWINAYNIMTIKGVVDNYPTKSVKDIKLFHGFFSRIDFPVAGEQRTLNDIEHEILREKFDEPRIHFAIVCASASCPRLRQEVYRPETLDRQLDVAAREFLATPSKNLIDPENRVVKLSEIFKWFAGDFEEAAGSVLQFIARYVDDEKAAFLRANPDSDYFEYDWSLNDQHPI